MAGNPPNVPTENIDEVILRLLALEPNEVDELDYETYRQYLKELLIEITTGKRKIDSGEAEQIKNEFVRVKGKKGRFKISSKKTKVTANGLGLGGIRKQMRGAQQRIMLMPVGGIPKDKKEVKEKVETVSKKKKTESDPLTRISKTLDSILKTLISIDKENKKKSDTDRRESERKRRGSREKELESKPLEGIKKAISNILKPFQSIWDTILNFIGNIILGRILIKLIDWFADPNNQGKIQSIIRFFSDHWPTLLALYLRFGTGIGRFIGKLTKILVKGTVKLVGLAAKLAAKAGLKGFGKVASFIGGPRGRLLATGLGIAADVAVTAGTAVGIKNLADGGEEKVPGFSGGGWSGRIKDFFGNMFSGLVNGPKGRDKVPAMLTDGEFVMSVGAVRKYGVDTLEAMNAAGGGTNIPQIANGITYAAGGGAIGAQEAWTNYMKANPEKFAKGAEYGNIDAVNKASRDFMRTFMKTGKPPEWAKFKQKTTKVKTPKPPSSSYTKGSQPPPKQPKPPSSSATPKPKVSSLSTDVRPSKPGAKIPRGLGSIKSLGVELLASYLIDKGFEKVDAMLIARSIKSGNEMTGQKRDEKIENLRNLVDKEERWQRGFGGMFDKIIGMGRESSSEKLSRSARAVLEGMGSSAYQGGKVVGGYGLKKQDYKKMPKTQIMTDDKGRPFVGYKAMRGGKPVYVRGPKAGTGTTNPLEMIGRMINPNAYKENDARLARQKHKESLVDSLQSLQERGASIETQKKMMKQMGGNLKDVQNDLSYRNKRKDLISKGKLKPDGTKYTGQEQMRMKMSKSQVKKPAVKPPPKPQSKPQIAGGGMNGRRGSGARPSTNGQKPKTQNPTHSSTSTRTARSTLGINKR